VSRPLVSLGALFFLSGVAGLIYQVLWLRLLSLTFGVTVYAATTVLAAFMAGLGAGSLLGGRRAATTERPLRDLGVVELLIGASALATPLALSAAAQLYGGLHASLGDAPAPLTAARFVSSLLVLLVPTTLMGATLPLVTRASFTDQLLTGRHVGVLYACNTAGAIAGALAAGFFLIGAIGIRASFVLASALNVGVGLVALALSARMRAAPVVATDASVEGPEYRPHVRRAVLAVFAVSGLVALALEVVWFRVLVLLLPATTYAFTTMLAAVLGGIAAGSAAAVPLLRRPRDWPRTLAFIEVGIGAAVLISMYLLAITYQAGWRTSDTIQASVLAIVPSAFLMGIAFPLGVRIYAAASTSDGHGRDAATARLGTLYAVNVAGAIIGSVLAGFVLLPGVGSRSALLVLAGLQIATGCLLLAATSGARRVAALGLAGASVWALIAMVLPDLFATALSRRHPPGEELLWREEGIQTTVSVNRNPEGQRVMYLDGLHQANDSPEMIAVHRMIGHLPMLLHPQPSEVLVVGLGGGATAGAVSRHGAAIDLVELSSSVVGGAGWFAHVNDDVLRRPNVRLRLDDGRNHLLLSGRTYDVITADIIQPTHAGAGSLYSAEYFSLARRALKPGGLLLQWIGHREPTHYALIMRTFLQVFPDATVWVDGSLLVGSTAPLRLDRAALDRTLSDPEVRDAVARVGITDAASLLRLYTAGPDAMRRFVGDGPILSDDRPLVEYHRSLPASDGPLDLSSLRGDVSEILR
jgi:spermidine synthase